MGSFEGMLIILANFGFVNQTTKDNGIVLNTLTLKGRIAKEVDIFVTQVIVEAVLDPLDHFEIAALLSAFVCDYRPRGSKNDKGEE
jgi:superfamily II RNA helicase